MRESPKTVADLMITAPATVRRSATVGEAIDRLRDHGQAGLPVVEGDRLVGFVTPIRLLRQPLYRTVGEVGATDIVPARPDLPIGQAYERLVTQHADILPVVEGVRLVGLIT